jgi:hypothetical protein
VHGQAIWRFTDVTDQAGLTSAHGYVEVPPSLAQNAAGGVAAGDIDGDGFVDLYVLGGDAGPNRLFHNQGDGTFVDVAAQAGVALQGRSGSGPLFFDFDGDGRLDLFVGAVDGGQLALFHNEGDGTFRDVTDASGLAGPSGSSPNTLSANAADYDGDGRLDLFLSRWQTPGEQPLVLSGPDAIVAGTVTSRTLVLTPETQDPLAIVQNDATSCAPPLPTDATYGGRVTLTFNTPIEIVGSTYHEDFDNALTIIEPTPPTPTAPPYTTTYYCPLKTSLNDPAQQERGSKIELAGAALIFSFNPSTGLATTYPGTSACTLPPSFTSINYAGANALVVQPVGDPSRKQTLANLLFQTTFTSSTVTCPMRAQ